jgi:hypothetical protein
LAATIVQLGCPAVGVTGYPLGHFKIAAILEKIRDPGCADRMVEVNDRNSCIPKPPFEH